MKDKSRPWQKTRIGVRGTNVKMFFFFQAEDGIRYRNVTGVQTCALPIFDEISIRFPELHQPLSELPTEAIIDGEIITARGAQILPFSDLQKRLGRKTVGEDLLKSAPVVFVGWDLLYATNQVLIDEPLRARRARLEDLVRTAC